MHSHRGIGVYFTDKNEGSLTWTYRRIIDQACVSSSKYIKDYELWKNIWS